MRIGLFLAHIHARKTYAMSLVGRRLPPPARGKSFKRWHRGTGRCGFDSQQRMPATLQTDRSSRSMAGDWIKMRGDLGTHPKVVRIMSALKADRLRVVGGLHAVWSLFDAHSRRRRAGRIRLSWTT